MEHIRSTLATTAVAVLGLIVAAHVLHPGNFEDQPRPTQPAAAQTAPAPAAVTAWADPPFALYLRPSATAPEMAILAPRMTAPLPIGTTMAPAVQAELVAAVDRPERDTAARQHRPAHHVVRARPTVLGRARTAAAAPTIVRPARGVPSDVPSRDPARDDEG